MIKERKEIGSNKLFLSFPSFSLSQIFSMEGKKIWTRAIGWLLLLGVTSADCYAQTVKQTENLQQVWTGYFNQTRFSKRWGAWLDLQLRTKNDFFTEFSQSIIRPGITY